MADDVIGTEVPDLPARKPDDDNGASVRNTITLRAVPRAIVALESMHPTLQYWQK